MTSLDDDLVALLRLDGRASFSDLATRLRTPRAQVAAHVHEMIADGTIRIIAAVHPHLLGLHAMAHVSIQTVGPSEEVLARLVEAPAAVLVSTVSGRHDIVVELRMPNQSELYAMIAQIRSMPHVDKVETLVYVDVPFGILMPQSPLGRNVRIDETDLAAISLLSSDGRMSFTELGAHLGISASATRKRIVHLLDSEVLRVGATVTRRRDSGAVATGVGLNVIGSGDTVIEALSQLDGVEFIARTMGRYDVVATLSATAAPALRRRIEELKSVRDVSRMESWIHLEILKERYEMQSGGVVRPALS